MTAGTARLQALVETARDHAPDARSALLRNITDLFLDRSHGFSAAELQHFDAIFSFLLRDASAAIKREIAERLADATGAPRSLVAKLACEDVTVAEPVLRRAALSEAEMAEIVAARGPQHWRLLAQRSDLSAAACEALAAEADEETLVNLAKNQHARLSVRAMRQMIAAAHRRPALQAPLTARLDLPPQLLTQLYFFVAASLKREILNRADMLDPMLVDVAAAANRRSLVEEAAREEGDETAEARLFIAEKMRLGEVNETLLKTLMNERRHTEFVYAFAWLIGVDMPSAQIILRDSTFEPLAIACRAARLSRQTFARMVFALRRGERAKIYALRILDIYIKVPEEAAGRIMRFWRMRTKAGRDAAFQDYGSVKRLEHRPQDNDAQTS